MYYHSDAPMFLKCIYVAYMLLERINMYTITLTLRDFWSSCDSAMQLIFDNDFNECKFVKSVSKLICQYFQDCGYIIFCCFSSWMFIKLHSVAGKNKYVLSL